MPVTFSLTAHPARSDDVKPVTSAEILQKACPKQFEQVDRILQSSVGGRSGPDDTQFKIVPNNNGFINTVLTAYSYHYALVIRPDDVWLAIISQFSFYVNANAELLRATFVVLGGIPPDFAAISNQMVELIHCNVMDPALREWILPNFSTTTNNDTTVGCTLMMATMKNYHSDYKMNVLCGIPRVTLEGERQDWDIILRRLEKLKEYGIETIAWYHLLFPVISRLVKAFEDPGSPTNLEFWQKVACTESCGSGTTYWSGWITAFCVFSTEGQWRGPKLHTDRTQSKAPELLPSWRFWASYIRPLQELRPHLTLDGTEYPVVNTNAVPAGYAEVEIILDNNGATAPCVIVAGMVGIGFSSSRTLTVSPTGKNDTVRPVVAWWVCSKLDDAHHGAAHDREDMQYQTPFIPPLVPSSKQQDGVPNQSHIPTRETPTFRPVHPGRNKTLMPGDAIPEPVRRRRVVSQGVSPTIPEPVRHSRIALWK
ncbi:hypothetical protein DFH09DRAFT_1458478 [Mycena vulgaris]|nr:hypothetical protein DFH09DRAFT_1458478 [Mycena vulgaris]